LIERYTFYKEFKWTPDDLNSAPLQEVEDLKQLLSIRRQIEEREQKAAERRR